MDVILFGIKDDVFNNSISKRDFSGSDALKRADPSLKVAITRYDATPGYKTPDSFGMK